MTKGKLLLAGSRPYVLLRAERVKNKRESRQYIHPSLAADLASLVARKTPTAPVFSVQAACDLAEALRDDLADARKAWIAQTTHGTAEREEREQSDFLSLMTMANRSIFTRFGTRAGPGWRSRAKTSRRFKRS